MLWPHSIQLHSWHTSCCIRLRQPDRYSRLLTLPFAHAISYQRWVLSIHNPCLAPVPIFFAHSVSLSLQGDTNHALLGMFQSTGIAAFFTELLKLLAGRPRPNFLELCQYSEDGNVYKCTAPVGMDTHLAFVLPVDATPPLILHLNVASSLLHFETRACLPMASDNVKRMVIDARHNTTVPFP